MQYFHSPFGKNLDPAGYIFGITAQTLVDLALHLII